MDLNQKYPWAQSDNSLEPKKWRQREWLEYNKRISTEYNMKIR